jgi:hypothetical protein
VATSSTTPFTPEQRNQHVNLRLATRFDALNKAFIEAEARLKSLRPIREVWVTYNEAEVDPRGAIEWELLGISKLQNAWRLVHAFGCNWVDGAPADIKPIVDCPIELRVQAATQVARLYAEIIEDKERYLPLVTDAVKHLQDFCAGK